MADQAGEGVAVPTPPHLRHGPGAFAWISLGLFVLAVGALIFALLVEAYVTFLVLFFAVLALSIPTLILMAAWIEVQIDNRRATRRYEAAVAGSAAIR
jgi:hypothetical protein